MDAHYNFEIGSSSQLLSKSIAPKTREFTLKKIRRALDELIELTNGFSTIAKKPEKNDLRGILQMIEINLICCTLHRTAGSQTQAAYLLGINHTTLNEKLKRLGIDANKFKVNSVSLLDAITEKNGLGGR